MESRETRLAETITAAHTTSLSRQLVVRVLWLSVLALVGGIGALVLMVGLGTLQAQQRLNEVAVVAAQNFNEFFMRIRNDLVITASNLETETPTEIALRPLFERNLSFLDVFWVKSNGTVLAQQSRVGRPKQTVFLNLPWDVLSNGAVFIDSVQFEQNRTPVVLVMIELRDTMGSRTGALVARVDLTELWNAAIGLRVGASGYVYITDTRGQLIAYRNRRLLEQGTVLSELIGRVPRVIVDSALNLYRGIDGSWVIATGRAFKSVSWFVIVEQPILEAGRPLLIPVGLMLVGLVLVTLLVYGIGRFVRQRIALRLDKLRQAVELLSQGKAHEPLLVEYNDELGMLAQTFNALGGQVQELLTTLESRVYERTSELQRRSAYLEASAEVGRAVTSILDMDVLLRQVVEVVREGFDFYYVGLFLVDEAGEWAILRAGTGEAGQKMLARNHRRRVGEGMIGWSVAHAQLRVAQEAEGDTVRLGTPELPETRAEAALPLRSRGKVIGALTVQSAQRGVFDKVVMGVLQTMTDQVAVAIDNVRLFSESQTALDAMQRAYGRMSREAWSHMAQQRPDLTQRYDPQGLLSGTGEVFDVTPADPLNPTQSIPAFSGKHLSTAIMVGSETIGTLNAIKPAESGGWSLREVELLRSLSAQLGLALESARLYQDTRLRAAREELISTVTARMRESLDMEIVLQTAVRELRQVLDFEQVEVRLDTAMAHLPETVTQVEAVSVV